MLGIARRRPTQMAGAEDATVRRVLHDVERALTQIGQDEIGRLGQGMPDARQLDPILAGIRTIGRVRMAIADLWTTERALGADEAISRLEGLTGDVMRTIAAHAGCPHSAITRAALNRIASHLHLAESRLATLHNSREPAVVRSILVPSDLLYQAHRSLFPAERMLVVAGRLGDAGTVRLGATFDVTGCGPDTHRAHVRADSEKLGRALVAMDLSGTELGAWIHSHSDAGAHATVPSHIDLQQHQDWIRDYSANLLSAIMVDDGYVRFWGSALESGDLDLHIVGPGITQEDTHVYRLARG